MPNLTIDGFPVELSRGSTMLQAAEYVGVERPAFCCYERPLRAAAE